jgi:hypothetical protein
LVKQRWFCLWGVMYLSLVHDPLVGLAGLVTLAAFACVFEFRTLCAALTGS